MVQIFPVSPLSLTSGEEGSLDLQAASVLQPTGQLTEVAAVQVHGDLQGMSAALHLVTHRRVCNTETAEEWNMGDRKMPSSVYSYAQSK